MLPVSDRTLSVRAKAKRARFIFFRKWSALSLLLLVRSADNRDRSDTWHLGKRHFGLAATHYKRTKGPSMVLLHGSNLSILKDK